MTPRRSADVALLTQKPDRPFVEVALLTAEDERFMESRLLQELRDYGARLGCDAVIVLGHADRPHIIDKKTEMTEITASCIQYAGPPPLQARTDSAR